MPPPFGPFAGKHRGPPPFVVQFLRAPLTLNNIIAGAITYSVHAARKQEIRSRITTLPHAANGRFRACHRMPIDPVFGMLTLLFVMSIAHNFMSFARFHRIRKSVFGESFCASRRRWKQKGFVMDEDEKKAYWANFKELNKKIPSAVISITDIILAFGFLGSFVLTLLLAQREGKVELKFAYANVGALVSFIFNFMIGMNGLKFWARQKQEQREAQNNVFEADVKEKLLEA